MKGERERKRERTRERERKRVRNGEEESVRKIRTEQSLIE